MIALIAFSKDSQVLYTCVYFWGGGGEKGGSRVTPGACNAEITLRTTGWLAEDLNWILIQGLTEALSSCSLGLLGTICNVADF